MDWRTNQLGLGNLWGTKMTITLRPYQNTLIERTRGKIQQSLGGDFSVNPRRDSAGTDQSANIRKNESSALGFFICKMNKTTDLAGQKFGRLVVSSYSHSDNGAFWICVCECGTSIVKRATELRRHSTSGRVLSCGCITAKTRIFSNGIVCTGCLQIKKSNEFAKSGYGYQPKCKQCTREWRIQNAEYLKRIKADYHMANRERLNKRASERQAANKDQANQRSKKWREANPDRRKEIANAWVKRNPEKSTQRQRLRSAKAKSAQPKWADKSKMNEIYKSARLRRAAGEHCHVDHIVPLISKLVSGLHCEANLQIISAQENQSKGNRYWPDMP